MISEIHNRRRRSRGNEANQGGLSIRGVHGILIVALLLSTAFPALAASKRPNEEEWKQITADYQWLQTLRSSAKPISPDLPRKEQIEIYLQNEKQVEPVYARFLSKLEEYYTRTGDSRAASLYAKEKIRLADVYINVLSRYERAMGLLHGALQLDPGNQEALQKLELAESRRVISMDDFARVQARMKEKDVQLILGLPREDWIRLTVQNGRAYAVWIYPKSDGGAAAIYFEDGVVYHSNWNAAPAPDDDADAGSE